MLFIGCASQNVGTYNKIDKKEMEKSFDKYMGTPYKWGGTEPRAGVDCSGLTSGVYNDQGVIIPRTSRLQYTVGDAVARNQLQYGDLVFFDTLNKGVSHVGVYVGDEKMVHASSSMGVTVTPITTDYWKKRYIGARRLTGSNLVAGEVQGERHLLPSSYPFMIRRMIDIPTTDIIENRFIGLDVQNDIGGNLRAGAAFSLWNFWEIGAEMQVNEFLGDQPESFGIEAPFIYTKIRFYQQKGMFPSLAFGAESMSRKWALDREELNPDRLVGLDSSETVYEWSPPKNAYIAATYKYNKLKFTNLGRGRVTGGFALTDLYHYHNQDTSSIWDGKGNAFIYFGWEQQLSKRFIIITELDNLFLKDVKASWNMGFQLALNNSSSISYAWRNIASKRRELHRAMQFSYILEY